MKSSEAMIFAVVSLRIQPPLIAHRRLGGERPKRRSAMRGGCIRRLRSCERNFCNCIEKSENFRTSGQPEVHDLRMPEPVNRPNKIAASRDENGLGHALGCHVGGREFNSSRTNTQGL